MTLNTDRLSLEFVLNLYAELDSLGLDWAEDKSDAINTLLMGVEIYL